MSLGDKVTGKVKQAAGDLTGDKSMHQEGRDEEKKSDAKEDLAREQEKTENKAQEVANLENRTKD